MQATFRQMPSRAMFDPELRQACSKSEVKDERSWDDISDALHTNLREGTQMRWWELRAVELVVEEANEEFDGEDTLGPRLRQVLHDAKCRVQSIRDDLGVFGGPLELSEPDEEHIQLTKELLNRAREHSGS